MVSISTSHMTEKKKAEMVMERERKQAERKGVRFKKKMAAQHKTFILYLMLWSLIINDLRCGSKP